MTENEPIVWRVDPDRAWEAGSHRKDFEKETGMEPLADYGPEQVAQQESGYAAEYEARFKDWASQISFQSPVASSAV